MREIKFRVWTGIGMEYRVVTGALGTFYVEGLDPKDSACLSPFNTKYSDQTPVMQFTGLHDKNGKEIYEGDIVEYENGNAGYGRPRHEEISRDVIPDLTEHEEYDLSDSWACGEVIGNIHENPEIMQAVSA